MMKSDQDETALLNASREKDKMIVSKALLIVVGSSFLLGIGVGLAIYHLGIRSC